VRAAFFARAESGLPPDPNLTASAYAKRATVDRKSAENAEKSCREKHEPHERWGEATDEPNFLP